MAVGQSLFGLWFRFGDFWLFFVGGLLGAKGLCIQNVYVLVWEIHGRGYNVAVFGGVGEEGGSGGFWGSL